MRVPQFFLLLFNILLVGCTSTHRKSFHDVQPGLERGLAQLRFTQVSNVEYKLNFEIPESKDLAIFATADLFFDFRGGTEPVILDFKEENSNVSHFHLNGSPTQYQIRNQHLILSSGLKPGRNHLSMKYETRAPSINRNVDFVYTLFVPDRASQAFPSFDQPDLKAKFSLRLSVPAKWVAVSNEKIISANSKGQATYYEFSPTPPISTYLFAFAAGRFQVVTQEGPRPMKMYYRESDPAKVKRNRKKIFALHTEALRKLEEYTQIPYPFSKLDFVLIPSFQFSGMEHPGAIFYNEQSLMLDPSATTGQVMGRASLVAHEVAHMWFGDLVTMRWFDDVWLKEVMANFLAAKVMEPMFPEFNHQLKFYLRHYPKAYDIDRTEGANAVRQELDNLQNAGSIYGPIIYLKAPIVLKQLEGLMTESKFRQGIRDYLQKFQFGNADWSDLLTSLQVHTEIPLKPWSHTWLELAGRPTIPMKIEKKTMKVDGMTYGYIQLDPISRDFLLQHILQMPNPLDRAAAWMTLWDNFYVGEIEPMAMAELSLRALQTEKQSLLVEFILERFDLFYWTFLRPAERASLALEWEKQLWRLLMGKGPKDLRATYWRTLMSIALSEDMLNKMKAILDRRVHLPDLPMSESDEMDLAYELALKLPSQSQTILDRQLSRMTSADRQAEFTFVRTALIPDEKLRRQFYFSLKDPANRKKERWVEKALQYLGHPLVQNTEYMVEPGLEWVESIQRTNNIFFPQTWIKKILSGQQSARSAQIVRKFLADRPNYPQDLKEKILQSGDMLFRAAKRN